MLEFYQAYSDYRDLMTMTEHLLETVARDVLHFTRGTLGTAGDITGTPGGAEDASVTFGGRTVSFRGPYPRVRLRQAACDAAAERLGTPVSEADLRNRETAAQIAARLDVETAPDQGPGKISVEIFERLCEPALLQPTFVHDFPTEVSPLSKQRDDDPDTVERFELFVAGMELANGFSELNDPAEQRRRFEAQIRDRQGGDLEAHRMDEDYVRALGVRFAPDGRRGHRHRPAGDGPDRQSVHPRRDPVPPHAREG